MKTLGNHPLILASQIVQLLGCTAAGPLSQANIVASLSNNVSRIQSSIKGYSNDYPNQRVAPSYDAYPNQPVQYYLPVSYPAQDRAIKLSVIKVAPKEAPITNDISLSSAYPTVRSSVYSSLLLAEVGVRARFVSAFDLGRSKHPSMKPTFITIHSTGSASMNATDYASAMSRGLPSRLRPGASRAGKLSWHFTVDSAYAIQHLSTLVQGGHADFSGPGNTNSIGIEMCEYRGINLGSVMDRTAKLAAYLMWQHQIPLNHVVPHYHWPRPGVTPYRKACPHFLMDNGCPGAKWAAFKNRILTHYQRLQGPMVYAQR
jgi:N-acetylmuramoyl-L-alanine amidase